MVVETPWSGNGSNIKFLSTHPELGWSLKPRGAFIKKPIFVPFNPPRTGMVVETNDLSAIAD
jgi:hypothetical protein